MPHFSMSGSFSDMLKGKGIPKISVDWYYKGAIFKQPTLLCNIGVGDKYKGMGSNAEAIIPLDSMYRNLADIVNQESNNQPVYVVVNVDNKISTAIQTEVYNFYTLCKI